MSLGICFQERNMYLFEFRAQRLGKKDLGKVCKECVRLPSNDYHLLFFKHSHCLLFM